MTLSSTHIRKQSEKYSHRPLVSGLGTTTSGGGNLQKTDPTKPTVGVWDSTVPSYHRCLPTNPLSQCSLTSRVSSTSRQCRSPSPCTRRFDGPEWLLAHGQHHRSAQNALTINVAAAALSRGRDRRSHQCTTNGRTDLN